MDSSMANKIYKARLYAEPERIHIQRLEVELEGTIATTRSVSKRTSGAAIANISRGHCVCAHTMTLERVFGGMLKSVV